MENQTDNKRSAFDPDERDPNFYSSDPYQHGDSDYGRVSEGTNVEQFNSVSGMDQDTEHRDIIAAAREAASGEGHPDTPKGENYDTTQEWDVDAEAIERGEHKERHMISNEAARKLEQIPDNPSDEAFFSRNDATYLEQDDNPNTDYDPHNQGYDDRGGKRKM